MVGCVVAYDGIDFDGVFNVVFFFNYFFLYAKITMVGGNRWIWVVVMEVIVNEVWGSKEREREREREREVLSLEKLNNFF